VALCSSTGGKRRVKRWTVAHAHTTIARRRRWTFAHADGATTAKPCVPPQPSHAHPPREWTSAHKAGALPHPAARHRVDLRSRIGRLVRDAARIRGGPSLTIGRSGALSNRGGRLLTTGRPADEVLATPRPLKSAVRRIGPSLTVAMSCRGWTSAHVRAARSWRARTVRVASLTGGPLLTMDVGAPEVVRGRSYRAPGARARGTSTLSPSDSRRQP
jgi:hypothetical protein